MSTDHRQDDPERVPIPDPADFDGPPLGEHRAETVAWAVRTMREGLREYAPDEQTRLIPWAIVVLQYEHALRRAVLAIEGESSAYQAGYEAAMADREVRS